MFNIHTTLTPTWGHCDATDLQRAARFICTNQFCSAGDEFCANGNSSLSQVVPQHRVKHTWDTVPAIR